MAKRHATIEDVEGAYPILEKKVTQHHVNVARHFVNLSTWGSSALEGHIEAAAHFAAASPGSGIAAAATTSRSMGSVSASYAVPTATDPAWGSTTFGNNFVALRDSLRTTPVVGRKHLIVV